MEISKKVIASIWQQAKKIQGEKFKAKAKAKLKEKVNKLEKKAKQKLNDFLKKFN